MQSKKPCSVLVMNFKEDETMKKLNVKVEKVLGGFAIYVNENYIGTFNKTITNIKLRGWNLPEVEID